MMQIEGGRAAFYQWDVNQRLEVDNPEIREVHFTNAVTSPALVCVVYEENGVHYANVPNILLQQFWPIQAYGYCGSRVRDVCVCKVIRRERPADYVYTETEVKSFDALEERIKSLEEGGAGGGGIATETDPTVPAWAKQPEKPTYTAKEVGAASVETVRQLSEEKADKKDIPAPYTLPVAAADTLGGVKVGSDFVMDGETLKAKPKNKYELVAELVYEAGSDVHVIEHYTMANGEPYAFKALRLTGIIRNADVAKASTSSVRAYSGDKYIEVQWSSGDVVKNKTNAVFAEIKNGMLEMCTTGWSAYEWVSGTVFQQPRGLYVGDGVITKIFIGSNTAYDGYAFKIEGVRA